ncbi:unnamed protein product [marine sediment metagenome]|uniref:Uncharacterized protein n=1 Tax=marine sediment metagenome TaxID=412755 RepID=X1VDD5_9ZZZZ
MANITIAAIRQAQIIGVSALIISYSLLLLSPDLTASAGDLTSILLYPLAGTITGEVKLFKVT